MLDKQLIEVSYLMILYPASPSRILVIIVLLKTPASKTFHCWVNSSSKQLLSACFIADAFLDHIIGTANK